jgi:hypothetical protein
MWQVVSGINGLSSGDQWTRVIGEQNRVEADGHSRDSVLPRGPFERKQ